MNPAMCSNAARASSSPSQVNHSRAHEPSPDELDHRDHHAVEARIADLVAQR